MSVPYSLFERDCASQVKSVRYSLPYWTQEVMGHDLDYTAEEWKALGEMGIKDAGNFMATVWQELENLNL